LQDMERKSKIELTKEKKEGREREERKQKEKT
jgi:hypothetical protein